MYIIPLKKEQPGALFYCCFILSHTRAHVAQDNSTHTFVYYINNNGIVLQEVLNGF